MSRYARGPPPDTSEMVSLKVDNLTYRTSADDIEYLFEKYGKIGDVFIPKDKFTRESRGFAFVRFYDKRDAEDAMDALDGRMYDGRDLRIQMAKYGRPDINRYISSILEFFSNEAARTGRKESYFFLSYNLI